VGRAFEPSDEGVPEEAFSARSKNGRCEGRGTGPDDLVEVVLVLCRALPADNGANLDGTGVLRISVRSPDT
jgi:hypothetical protein